MLSTKVTEMINEAIKLIDERIEEKQFFDTESLKQIAEIFSADGGDMDHRKKFFDMMFRTAVEIHETVDIGESQAAVATCTVPFKNILKMYRECEQINIDSATYGELYKTFLIYMQMLVLSPTLSFTQEEKRNIVKMMITSEYEDVIYQALSILKFK